MQLRAKGFEREPMSSVRNSRAGASGQVLSSPFVRTLPGVLQKTATVPPITEQASLRGRQASVRECEVSEWELAASPGRMFSWLSVGGCEEK